MPRVLVISNTALKRSNSNGLALLNILSAIPSTDIASFYIQDALPDKGAAKSHFRFTDKEKVKAFLFGKCDGSIIEDNPIPGIGEALDVQRDDGKNKESFYRHVVRDFVWKCGYWNKKKFHSWVSQFQPEVILFMNGRSPFMFDITRDLAKRFSLPVVYFMSEDEYWHPAQNFWDRILRRRLKKATLRLNKYVKHVVAFHDKLGEMCKDEFGLPVTVIMPSSSLRPVEKVNEQGNWLYAGNLKPYRYESLKDIADALHSIDSKQTIDVYSNDVDDEIKTHLRACGNISFHEAVNRGELDAIRRQASVLLHFESFSQQARPLIQNAFSSKIADCLALGIPFFVYAPPYCGFSSYFSKNEDSVCYANSQNSLYPAIERIIHDADYVNKLKTNSVKLAARCHNSNDNAKRMKELMTNLVEANR